MKLLNIKAKNFKGFETLNLDIDGKSSVVFGVNGTGKSSLLSTKFLAAGISRFQS